MLKSAIFSTLIVIIFSLSFLCSTGPISGIETGNPAMTACARAALSLLGDNSVWQPETYLVSGKKQLDPGTILSAQPSASLSKRTTNTDTSSSASREKIIIIQRVDTIINVSKVFVNDTITKTTSRTDTSRASESQKAETDSTTIITEKQSTTKIMVVDTVTVYDTFTVSHYDTIKSREMSADTPTSKTTTPGTKVIMTQPEASVNPVIKNMDVYLDIVSSTKSYSIPANYSSNICEIYSKISRSGSIGALNISEEYTDGDGDGNLLSAIDGTIPIVDLRASYSLQKEQQSLIVQFDAGTDKVFSQITDNRIHSLHRVKKVNNSIGEEITFTKIQSFSDVDSSLLTVTKSNPDDSVSYSGIFYSIINKTAPATPGADKLSMVQYTAQFRKGPYTSVKFSIQPDSLPDAGSALSKAKLHIFIDFGKGSAGSFDGSIDYQTKQVQGIYSENGNEFDFTFINGSNESTFEKR